MANNHSNFYSFLQGSFAKSLIPTKTFSTGKSDESAQLFTQDATGRVTGRTKWHSHLTSTNNDLAFLCYRLSNLTLDERNVPLKSVGLFLLAPKILMVGNPCTL